MSISNFNSHNPTCVILGWILCNDGDKPTEGGSILSRTPVFIRHLVWRWYGFQGNAVTKYEQPSARARLRQCSVGRSWLGQTFR
ncbi:hypothetical protein HanIR_Chr05g0223181 [Helianthus annuus]|nr:hypothetical protein HanIR_Chr05g0223181 [Helianthus annuus]